MRVLGDPDKSAEFLLPKGIVARWSHHIQTRTLGASPAAHGTVAGSESAAEGPRGRRYGRAVLATTYTGAEPSIVQI